MKTVTCYVYHVSFLAPVLNEYDEPQAQATGSFRYVTEVSLAHKKQYEHLEDAIIERFGVDNPVTIQSINPLGTVDVDPLSKDETVVRTHDETIVAFYHPN